MDWFILTMAVGLAITAGVKLYWLATGYIPRRKPTNEAIDVAINAVLIVWATARLFTD